MGEVTKRQFDYLMLNGKNYQTWVVDCRFHLAAMQLTHTITPRAEGAPAIPKHEIAKASIFLRHHIHKDLKQEYLESNKGQKPNSQGKGKAQKGDAGGSEHPNKGCFRCGSMNHWSRSCRTEPHLVQMYQEWKKRENPEAHFIQARVDAVTGEHTVVLPQPVEKPEGGNAMDVDPTNTSGGNIQDDDDDYNLDEEDTLDDGFGDTE
ncbi:unnamed protein product [Miscanthus lutarioriparius]|uniref:CCHC-type domain-containing protein n=1 Tax=Miscanthus lutarioriparius TaxID=422564 RepID=A0A811RF87_9POAL|nr:unnamed protein product [Miscanthus lutarioriparius]